MNFKYKVTVIVPVYNCEKYLPMCLDSLVNQTIDKDLMQVLLIDDGSKDNSLALLNSYAEKYPFFQVYANKNGGVSAARNFGIRHSEGMYIMYLDADDTLSENAVKDVTNFFDEVYDRVDMVTYTEITYDLDGTKKAPHLRYKFLKQTGIYDLNKTIFASQVRINIAVKNLGKNNIYFDEKYGFHEDQMYCTQILSEKFTLGYVKEAEYRYNRYSESITGLHTNALFLFEKTTAYWEQLFSLYPKQVPKYIQALFFHDISWKHKTFALWPFHYSPEELQKAKDRIFTLLDRVDNDVIMSYPNFGNYEKLFWIRQKHHDKTTPVVLDNRVMLYNGSEKIYSRADVEIILNRLVVRGSKVKIVGYFKSPVFSYCDNVKLYVRKNGRQSELEKIVSPSSYIYGKEQTHTFYLLIYEAEITEETSLEFLVKIDGVTVPTTYFNSKTTCFFDSFTKTYSVQNVSVTQKKNGFVFAPVTEFSQVEASIRDNSEKTTGEIKKLRIKSISALKKNEKIWLYYDSQASEKDNGYYQFMHDIKINDGVKRYYVITNFEGDHASLFPGDMLKNNTVEFGSEQHRLLFLAAEKIITAHIEPESLIPFGLDAQYQIRDIFHAEIIYLQHGILHAHMPWKYSPVGVEADKVVVSTQYEIDNFTKNYGFRKSDLIPSGMPRYSLMSRTAPDPKNRILFAPSWRTYLIGNLRDNNQGRQGVDEKILQSNYYKNILRFINSKKLADYLRKNNLDLDVKLHPIFYDVYRDLLKIDSDRVHLASQSVNLTDYSLFITDFSSFSFDFVYLSRPMMYFVPDYLEFTSGMNHYRELDIPYEKAFGKLTTDPEKAVDEVIRIAENGFKPDEVYKKRMDNFFLPIDNCTQNVYNNIVAGDSE